MIRTVRPAFYGEYPALIEQVRGLADQYANFLAWAEFDYGRAELYLKDLQAAGLKGADALKAMDDARKGLGDAWLTWRSVFATARDLAASYATLSRKKAPPSPPAASRPRPRRASAEGAGEGHPARPRSSRPMSGGSRNEAQQIPPRRARGVPDDPRAADSGGPVAPGVPQVESGRPRSSTALPYRRSGFESSTHRAVSSSRGPGGAGRIWGDWIG